MIHDINKGKNIVYSQFCALYLRIFKYILFRYIPTYYLPRIRFLPEFPQEIIMFSIILLV